MGAELIIAGVIALVGAGIGAWSAADKNQRANAEFNQKKREAQKQYELGKRASDEQWDIGRGKALDDAAIAEKRLDEGVDGSIDEYNTMLLAQAYGTQDARIQNESGIGMSRVAEGAGGTRGNAANELVRGYAADSFERQLGIQERQNSQALSGMVGQANNAMQDIARERASWDAGGWRYEEKAAQDTYNKGMADLGQSSMQWQQDYLNRADVQALNYITDIHGGMSSGWSMGTSIARTWGNFYEPPKKDK